MRKHILTITFIIFAITFALASSPSKGNPDRGRKQFRSSCKDCHVKGGAGGEVTPLSKTAAQWRSFFEKGNHAKGALAQLMGEQSLLDVQAYLVAHAADSEQPEICGR